MVKALVKLGMPIAVVVLSTGATGGLPGVRAWGPKQNYSSFSLAHIHARSPTADALVHLPPALQMVVTVIRRGGFLALGFILAGRPHCYTMRTHPCGNETTASTFMRLPPFRFNRQPLCPCSHWRRRLLLALVRCRREFQLCSLNHWRRRWLRRAVALVPTDLRWPRSALRVGQARGSGAECEGAAEGAAVHEPAAARPPRRGRHGRARPPHPP